MPSQLEEAQTKLSNVEHQLETAKAEVDKPFPQEAELSEKLERLAELNALLNMDEKGDDAIGMASSTLLILVIFPSGSEPTSIGWLIAPLTFITNLLLKESKVTFSLNPRYSPTSAPDRCLQRTYRRFYC